MKKLFPVILGTVLILSTGVSASTTAPSIVYNAEVKQIENIQNSNGRVILPFRAVFEMMGADVNYEASTSKVTAVRDNKTVEFYVGGTSIAVTDETGTTEIPAEIGFDYQTNRVMVPVRFVSNALGARVGWNGKQQCVYILDTKPMIKSLEDECSDFFKYIEKSNALEKNVKSEASADINFSGTFEGVDINAKLDFNSSENLYENSASGKLDLNFSHKNLDVLTGMNLGQAKDVTFDVIKEDNIVYIKTNLIENLQTLLPDNEIVKQAKSIGNKNTWFSVDLNFIEERFGTSISPDKLLKNLENSVYYTEQDVTEEEMYAVKQYFDIIKGIYKKGVLTETASNSFTFDYNLTSEDLSGLIYSEKMMKEANLDYNKAIDDLKSILNIDLNCNVTVKNGVIENETVTIDFSLNDSENDMNMSLNADISEKSQRLTKKPTVKAPKNSVSIETVLALFE